MRILTRPRTWIAGCAGIAAGLVVWMLPPQPAWCVAAMDELELRASGVAGHVTPGGVRLRALSPSGTHVLTSRYDDKDELVLELWDRTRSRDPISITGCQGFLFNPDGASMITLQTDDLQNTIHWLDLATGNVVKRQAIDLRNVECFFFSPLGKLHCVKENKLICLEDGQEVGILPASVDGFNAALPGTRSVWGSGFVLYVKNDLSEADQYHILVYDMLAGKESARMTIPGLEVNRLTNVSRDGQLIYALGSIPDPDPDKKRLKPQVEIVADGSGMVRVAEVKRAFVTADLSPNGALITYGDLPESPSLLQRWYRFQTPTDGPSMSVLDARTGREVARFRKVHDIAFSAGTDQLAVLGPDGVEGYPWPLHPPWSLLAAVMLGSAGAAWSIGWLWTRWRERRLRLEVRRETLS